MNSANKQQEEVIKHTEGPVLVIAGPGSGKTFTLVERIFRLISEKKIEPENILIATFTEKAARELVTRISNRLIEAGLKFNVNEMYVGTIHSICLRILEESREFTRLGRNYTVMDQFDQQYFLYQRMREYDEIEGLELIVRNQGRWKKSEALLKWINTFSEEYIDPDKLSKDIDTRLQVLAACYRLYQKQIEEADTLDFSTIQLETLHLLENHPDVLEKFRYLMIDEYQDTNTIQETIILKLAGTDADSNICVVGDDDQSLYRFRGATVRNILEFPEKFPAGKCRKVSLITNYRSHPDIIGFYNKWMQLGRWEYGGKSFRFDKDIQPRTGMDFSENPVVFRVAGQDGQDNWHDEVFSFLNGLKERGIVTDWNQVAFLFRSVKNPKIKSLAESLEEKGIPVYSPRANAFFDREEVRLLIGAFLFLFRRYKHIRQWDENIRMDIWDYYDECLLEFAGYLRQEENPGFLKWCQKKAKEILTLNTNADYGFSGLFYELLQFPLFSRYFADEKSIGMVDGRPARNLAIFSSLLVKFEYLHHISVLSPQYLDRNIISLFNQFIHYLKDGGINEYEDDSEYAPSGCVSFLTIHQSKGLEFPVVVVGSLDASPRKQYTELDELLQMDYYQKPPFEPIGEIKYYDFQRLFYTAFSRAQNLLVLSCQENTPKGRGQKNVPSKYFTDVYPVLPKWRDVDFSGVKLERVNDMNIKREYSFTSHITLFETCARQYRFYKDLGFAPVRQSPILFGTLVHETIEDVHKAVLRGEPEIVTPGQVEDWFAVNYANLSKKERVYLAPQTQNAALGHVLRYVDRQGGDWSHIKEAEVDVALVKDQYILKGKVDLIKGIGDTVEVVDFKSEGKPDLYRDTQTLERYRRQLEIYAHIIEERLQVKVSRMHLYYTGEKNGNPFVTFNKDSKHINETIAVIDQTVTRIENRDFHIDERPGKHCENCDIRHYCDTK